MLRCVSSIHIDASLLSGPLALTDAARAKVKNEDSSIAATIKHVGHLLAGMGRARLTTSKTLRKAQQDATLEWAAEKLSGALAFISLKDTEFQDMAVDADWTHEDLKALWVELTCGVRCRMR